MTTAILQTAAIILCERTRGKRFNRYDGYGGLTIDNGTSYHEGSDGTHDWVTKPLLLQIS